LFYSRVPAEVVTMAVLSVRHSTVDAALWWTEQLNLLDSVSVGTVCGGNSYKECSKCVDTSPQSFCHLFIALSIIRCSESAQKFAVPVCQLQVATVVIRVGR